MAGRAGFGFFVSTYCIRFTHSSQQPNIQPGKIQIKHQRAFYWQCTYLQSKSEKWLVATDRRACPGKGWVRRGRRCRDASGARPHRRVQTPGYSGVEIVRMNSEAVPCSRPWGGGACSGSPRRSWCPPGGRCRGWSAPGTWP